MKWEHKIIFGRRDVEILNQHGAEGWELAAVTVGMAYFKRPLPEPIEKTGSFEDVAKEIQAIGGGWNAIEDPEAFLQEMRGDDRNPVETRSGGWRDAIGCSPAGPGEDSPEDSIRQIRDGEVK